MFLSKEFLLRPWCLIELDTAITSGVPIVALNCIGKKYDFVEAVDFMLNLETSLATLNPGALDVLEKNGVDPIRLAHKLHSVIPNIIAIPLNSSASDNAIKATMADLINAVKDATPMPVDESFEAWLATRGVKQQALLAAAYEQARLEAEQAAEAERARTASEEQARLEAEQATETERVRAAADEQARLEAERAGAADEQIDTIRVTERGRMDAERADQIEVELRKKDETISKKDDLIQDMIVAHKGITAMVAKLMAKIEKLDAKVDRYEEKLGPL